MRSSTMLAVALATLLIAAPAGAQLLPGRGGFGRGGGGFSPIIAGRASWSIRDSSPAVGAEIRIPVPIPVLRPSITPGGDVVFQSGLVERQGMLDVTLGILQPFFFGGGPAVLNSVFEDTDGERATKGGFTVLAGIRGGRLGPLTSEVSFRLLRVSDLHPRFLGLALGYPILGLLR